MESAEQKKRQRHLDRIKLNAENFAKVDGWISDLKVSKQGISVSHSDLVNWVLSHAVEHLSDSEKNELKSQFFDEVKFLKELLLNAKKAKANGEKVEIGHLMKVDAPKRKYRRRKVETETTETSTPTEA